MVRQPHSRRDRRRRPTPEPDRLTLWRLRTELVLRESPDGASRARRRIRESLFLGEGAADVPRPISAIRRELRRLAGAPLRADTLTLRNAALFASALSLEEGLARVFTYLAHTRLDEALGELAGPMLDWPVPRLASALATILDLRGDVVLSALRRGSPLIDTGIVERGGFGGRFDGALTVAASIRDALQEEHQDADALLDAFCRRAPAPKLTLQDYPHAIESIEAARAVLAGAIAENAVGVNILLHGPPGTGKSQAARLIGALCGAFVAEVPVEDRDGDPRDGEGRLTAYRLAQRILAKRDKSAVIFDEAEESLGESGSLLRLLETDAPVRGKAWRAELLDGNARPTIWICNQIGAIDSALLRRFDLVLEIRAPGPEVRRRMLETALAGLPIGVDWFERHAADERLAPAFVERAARALRFAGLRAQPEAERFVARALRGVLATQAGRATSQPSRPVRYDLSFTRTSLDLEAIARGFAARRRGSACLHGPPGTGKSEYARFLAARLGIAVVVRRLSDLMDRYVGGTERNLAAAFEEARDLEAMLLLEEVDGLLRARTEARHSWEITQVNELLVQMETYDGVLVCTTNLFEDLDQAALRRFDLKVRFEPMTSEQRRRMFVASLDAGPELDTTIARALDRMNGLTPGDFATAVRKLALVDLEVTSETLLEAIEGEWRVKPDVRQRRLGFEQA